MNVNRFEFPASFKGRYLGILILVLVQILVGTIHVVIGLGLILAMYGEFVYSVYTFLYGIFTIFFAYGLWVNKRSGWVGTILVSIFVIVVDVSTVLNVPLIPGVPRSAAFGEILYSLAVLLYVFQPKIIHVFNKKQWLQDFEFGEIPPDVFKQYDEMRCGLADEVLFSINETMANTQVETIVKRIQKVDIDILSLIRRVGPTYYARIKESIEGGITEALIRLKARGLIVPRRESKGYYKYHITELGFSVLEAFDKLPKEF